MELLDIREDGFIEKYKAMYGMTPKLDRKSTGVRRLARRLVKQIDNLLDVSGIVLEEETEIMLAHHTTTVSHRLVEHGKYEYNNELIEWMVDNDELLLYISPIWFHSFTSNVMSALFTRSDGNSGWVLGEVITAGLLGGWNVHLHGDKAHSVFVAVDRRKFIKWISTVRAGLKGLSLKKKLSDDEWIGYAKVVVAGLKQYILHDESVAFRRVNIDLGVDRAFKPGRYH